MDRAGGVRVATKIAGNVFDLPSSRPDDADIIRISRADMAKSRQRIKTAAGSDVGIILGRGTILRHGDVLQGDGLGRPIIVEQVPETVAQLRFENPDSKTLIIAGHIIGNRHRPVSVKEDGGALTFPIQDRTELETFERLFAEMAGDVKISADEEIFIPHKGADVQVHE